MEREKDNFENGSEVIRLTECALALTQILIMFIVYAHLWSLHLRVIVLFHIC